MESERKRGTKRKTKVELDQLAEVRETVEVQLYTRGYSIEYIRREVMRKLNLDGLSKRTVWKDLQRIRADWREYRISTIDEYVTLQQERLNEVIRTAWESYENSKGEKTRTRQHQKGVPATGEGGGQPTAEEIEILFMEQTTDTEENAGDPRYLSIIKEAIQELNKLMGLYPAEKREITTPNNNGIRIVVESQGEAALIDKFVNRDNADQTSEG